MISQLPRGLAVVLTATGATVPSAAFGTREVEFEDEEARRLAELLQSWPKVTIRGVAWIERVVSDLKSERPVPAEGVHKNARRKG